LLLIDGDAARAGVLKIPAQFMSRSITFHQRFESIPKLKRTEGGPFQYSINLKQCLKSVIDGDCIHIPDVACFVAGARWHPLKDL
jgi:hypothetical protein